MNNELVNLLAERGGLVNIGPFLPQSAFQVFSLLEKRARANCRIAEEHLYNLRPRTVNFGLIDDNTLNAIAYCTRSLESPAFDFIGLNIGTPTTLVTIFMNMLARRNILPDIGDVELELEEIPPIEFLSPNVVRDQIFITKPRCPVRELFATELMVTACDFFFFHELSHLKNGHVELWRKRSGASSIVEINSTFGIENLLLRRALETHADFGGAEGTLRGAMNSYNLLKQRSDLDSDMVKAGAALYGSPFLAMQLATFAIYVICRLFREDVRSQSPQASALYPPPAVRFFSAVRSLMTYYHEVVADGVDHSDEFIPIVVAAENACATICGEDADARAMVREAQVQLPGFAREFEENWTKIAPALEGFMRGSVLHPVGI